MLVFNEGVPRSGKSYDAVKNHILPAIKAKRRVYARLNGLNHERIAAYLQMSLDEVKGLLTLVSTAETIEFFKAVKNEAGDWVLEEKFHNALNVIDEVHQFYVGGSRNALPPEQEEFFAMHGHVGADILVLSQFYKRVHTAIRYRVERKNVFQKLSAFGKKGEKMYRQTFQQTVQPDKYETVNGETRTYDTDIFPLYHGIVGGVDGEVEQEVYAAGRSSVWKKLLLPAAIVIPAAVFGAVYLLNFFSGGGKSLVKTTAPIQASYSAQVTPQVWQEKDVPETTRVETVKAPPPPTPQMVLAEMVKDMTPEQAYIWKMSSTARIRFAGVWEVNGLRNGLIEWVDSSGVVVERLTFKGIEGMGVSVSVEPFGVRLGAAFKMLIATAWPRNLPEREETPRLYNTSGDTGGGIRLSASEAESAPVRGGSVMSGASAALPAPVAPVQAAATSDLPPLR